jgi:chloramphenicol O-acetyltransferase type A
MKSKFDLQIWNRKEHYLFFKEFSEPFWGLTFELDVSKLYQRAKTENVSYFTLSLHRIMLAINKTDAFKLRIENDELFLYNTIHVSATIGRADHSFGFSFIEFNDDFAHFQANATKEFERIFQTPGLAMTQNTERVDTIHFSAIPWIPITALSHARHFEMADSVPKISTGKIISDNSKLKQSISVHSHHALADGYDAGLLYQNLQLLFNMD